MSLKFPFKFHHVLSSTVYTAKLRENQYDTVDVYWTDDDGREDSVDYYLSGVVNNVNDGLWKIIEDTTIDPLVEIRQSEYTALIEEINLLQELLAEANAHNQSIPEPTVFKPITEYTLEDWEQARNEQWVFELNSGYYLSVFNVHFYEDETYPVSTSCGSFTVDGLYYLDNSEPESNIKRRIK